jgi:hypothetical protein
MLFILRWELHKNVFGATCGAASTMSWWCVISRTRPCVRFNMSITHLSIRLVLRLIEPTVSVYGCSKRERDD